MNENGGEVGRVVEWSPGEWRPIDKSTENG